MTTKHAHPSISSMQRISSAQILTALSVSVTFESGSILPSIFIPLPPSLPQWPKPAADCAMAWYRMSGFISDRTRMNLHGYPGILRDIYYARSETDEAELCTESSTETTAIRVEMERERNALRDALGEAGLDSVLKAVFDFDEFTAAAGAPDILVWAPDSSCWFFSEVKAPGDSLRRSQTDWLRRHSDVVHGHYVLTILE